jgi:hypothetical protein
MMELMAERFPGCFSGYRLAVAESHQRTKADTSGTAKAVVASLNKMGLQFGEVGWGAGWGAVAGGTERNSAAQCLPATAPLSHNSGQRGFMYAASEGRATGSTPLHSSPPVLCAQHSCCQPHPNGPRRRQPPPPHPLLVAARSAGRHREGAGP